MLEPGDFLFASSSVAEEENAASSMGQTNVAPSTYVGKLSDPAAISFESWIIFQLDHELTELCAIGYVNPVIWFNACGWEFRDDGRAKYPVPVLTKNWKGVVRKSDLLSGSARLNLLRRIAETVEIRQGV